MKKKWLWVVDIAYWCIIIYCMFSCVFDDVSISDINKIINSTLSGGFTVKEILTTVFAVMGILIMLFFFSLISNIEITAIYIGIKIAAKKFKKDRLDKVDFKNDNYFKDKIPQYSPAVLSYVDDFELGKKDIVATLLSLELKKKIKIKDKIEVINTTYEDLTENEKYIFEKIQRNDCKNINMEEYESVIEKEAKDKGLLQEKATFKNKMNNMLWSTTFISAILMIVVFVFLGEFITTIDNELVIIMCFACIFVVIACAFLIPGVVIVYIIHYTMLNTIDPYVRTKEGKEINSRLEGLKKYLKDFSTLDEKTKEHLTLWEEFLIYSVMFGVNDKIVEEVYSKIS